MLARALKKIACNVALLSISTLGAHAQQMQPDGTMLMGGVRLNPKAPPPAQQRAACADGRNVLLGPLAMSFYGVTPWITNHPLLERNCATLLDIPPLSHGPFIKEMLTPPRSWWSRVTRVRMPDNRYGWREGFGFAWCADQSCRRNILYLFDETQLIGVCHATPANGGATRYVIGSPDGNEAWSVATGYRSCIEQPQVTTQAIAATPNARGAERYQPPRQPRLPDAPRGVSNDQQMMEHLQRQANERQARADAQRLAQERAAVAAAWERMQRPNSLGW